MATPKVSFVVPVYNMERFVADCLHSIICQDGDHDFEIVVIDDASTDSSAAIVQSFNDPRIRMITHERNRGAAATITEGFLASRGAYVARIDPDDRYRPYFLNLTVAALDANPDVGLVFGRVALIDSHGTITDPGVNKKREDEKGDFFIRLLTINSLPAPTVLGRREAWELGLPIPPRFHFNDWFLSLSIAEKWPLYFVDDVLAEYRVHENNMHASMVREGWAEPIIKELLEKFLSAPRRAGEMAKHKNSIYAAQYHQLADQYFSCGRFQDARRCYWRAVHHRPAKAVRVDVIRHLLGTYLGAPRYEKIKRFIKKGTRASALY